MLQQVSSLRSTTGIAVQKALEKLFVVVPDATLSTQHMLSYVYVNCAPANYHGLDQHAAKAVITC